MLVLLMDSTKISIGVGFITVALLMVFIPTGLLNEQDKKANLKQFSGRYSRGFEDHSFTTCKTEEYWWISADSPIDSWDLKYKYDSTVEEGNYGVYMTVLGSISEKGRYGHMGAGERLLEIHEILKIEPKVPDECIPRVIVD